ncbi:MAG: hypothetical protein ABI876_09910, partial [Bacteroidota bacterium]
MPQISLTDFVDIVSKAGRPKATKVLQVKDRPDYEPAFDFYKPLRDHIVETHRAGYDKKSISNVITGLTDPKKVKSYPDLVAGYKKWWGRKSIEWFNPPRDVYVSGSFEIIVNPELGLIVNGGRQIVKLYFKSEALSAFRIAIITDLMEYQLRSKIHPTDTFSIL